MLYNVQCVPFHRIIWLTCSDVLNTILSNELKHHFSNVEQTGTCSSIGDGTHTSPELVMGRTPFYRTNSNIIFRTLKELERERVHLLMVALEHLNLGFE